MKKQVILLISLFIAFAMFAQDRTCGTMENLEIRKQNDPNLQSRMDQIESFTQLKIQEMQNNKISGSIITIPVVVHVLYRNSTENISVAQIQSQLDVLNEDFRRTNSNADNTWSQAADTQIEFCLASVDPNGNTTSGITRKSTTRQDWGANDDAKSTSTGGINPWNTAEYLNMWIVPKMTTISQGQTINLLGYAQFPGGSAATDGLVMIYNAFGRVGAVTAPYDGGRTTTHEIGHYFNLRHIWGDSNCGNDFVSDTPTHQTSNRGCPTGQQSCGSTDMPQNYMDYTNDTCMNLFTQGQKNRMRAVLASGGARRTLALSDKCGGSVTPTCSDGIQNGNETGVDCGGSCAPCSTDTGCATTISSFPYTEGFESSFGSWTQSSADNLNWTRDANGTPSSGTGPSSATQGSYYVYVEASGNNVGYPTKRAILNSPCFNLSGKTAANFTFKYHMNGSSNMGSIKLEASTNNGASWTSIWSKSGNKGNSWLSADVDLSAYLGDTVKFRFNRLTGSTWKADVAIDNIKVTATAGNTGGPTNVTLIITFDDYPEESSWEIKNSAGQIVFTGGTYANQADRSTLTLSGDFAAGCYSFIMKDAYGDGMCCSYGNGSFTLKETTSGTILVSGGSFGSSSTTNFCVGGGSSNRYEAAYNDQYEATIGFNLYPNPANDILNIDMYGAESQLYEIYNSLGQVVKKGLFVEKIDISNLEQGLYIYKLFIGEKSKTKHFVKK